MKNQHLFAFAGWTAENCVCPPVSWASMVSLSFRSLVSSPNSFWSLRISLAGKKACQVKVDVNAPHQHWTKCWCLLSSWFFESSLSWEIFFNSKSLFCFHCKLRAKEELRFRVWNSSHERDRSSSTHLHSCSWILLWGVGSFSGSLWSYCAQRSSPALHDQRKQFKKGLTFNWLIKTFWDWFTDSLRWSPLCFATLWSSCWAVLVELIKKELKSVTYHQAVTFLIMAL